MTDSVFKNILKGSWVPHGSGLKMHLATVLGAVLLLWRDGMTKRSSREKSIQWGLAYSFRGSVCYQHGGEHGTGAGAESYILIHKQWGREAKRDTVPGKAHPSDTLPPRTHLLIPLILKQSCFLLTKQPNLWGCGDHFHSTHHSFLSYLCLSYPHFLLSTWKIIAFCYKRDKKCLPKWFVLKAWSPAGGTIEKELDYEMLNSSMD